MTRELFVPYSRTDVTKTIYARCRVTAATSTGRGTQFVIQAEPHIVEDIVQANRSKVQ